MLPARRSSLQRAVRIATAKPAWVQKTRRPSGLCASRPRPRRWFSRSQMEGRPCRRSAKSLTGRKLRAWLSSCAVRMRGKVSPKVRSRGTRRHHCHLLPPQRRLHLLRSKRLSCAFREHGETVYRRNRKRFFVTIRPTNGYRGQPCVASKAHMQPEIAGTVVA